jgi:hypothetical protein
MIKIKVVYEHLKEPCYENQAQGSVNKFPLSNAGI